MKKILLLLLVAFILTVSSNAQKNLAEMLGYPADSKLLIIHADDLGLSQSENAASMKAFADGSVTSGSIMVPCPWTYEVTDLIKKQQGLDVGIHLTLTAEWKLYKWDGVSSSDSIKSLLDRDGYFYQSIEEVGKNADPAEAGRELERQILKAMELGIQPTHLDTHMGSVLAKPELVNTYFSLGDKYHLPVLFPRSYINMLSGDMKEKYGNRFYLLDNLFMLDAGMIKNENWVEAYRTGINSLKPGLNQIIVHLAYDNDEMKAITKEHDDYGSAWRQKDFDFVHSTEFKDLLKANNVILISWGQVKNLMK
jgi:predicted glycoside hydrolase/deacetylase ChbG (UPF0249 family)